MKKGEHFVFTPNQKEFQKLISKLNGNDNFNIQTIDRFLNSLDLYFSQKEKDEGMNIQKNIKYRYEKGEDLMTYQEAVIDEEIFPNKESKRVKNYNKSLSEIEDTGVGLFSNETVLEHRLGQVINVIDAILYI